jgi:predicted transposase YbfD/YdcC
LIVAEKGAFPMHSTAQSLSLPDLSHEQHASLLADAPLLSLYQAFGAVPDPRSRHGQRYDLPYLLTCLVAALLCNCNSLEAVGQWCCDQQLLLRRLFGARDFSTPTGSLYRRLLPRLSVGHLELVLAAWVRASRPAQDEEAVALDGKTVRGAATAEQKGPHLLAFCTHETQETLLQVRVSEKTNEIPVAQELVSCLPMQPRVYTADALHTHASFMRTVHALAGFCVLTVKGNQPTLYADLATYFNDPHTVIAPSECIRTVDFHRGRTEVRLLEVTSSLNDYLAPCWPLVRQVARVTRTVTVRKTGKTTQEIVYLITDLTALQASPQRLLDLNRGHWSIENSLHYVRDVSFGEDRSRIRTGSAPQFLAALRNLAITFIHRTGSSQIAASRRHFASHPHKAFALLLQRRASQQ